MTPDLRASPRYELVPFDRLAPAEREAAAALGAPAEVYGLLRPRPGEALGAKAIDCDTALLFLTLGSPGPLPSYVHARLGERAPHVVAQLVAGGVLEVAGAEGFAGGAAGLDRLRGAPTPADTAEAPGLLAVLSTRALAYAARLAVDDPLLLANRLYLYNSRPLTPDWARRLPDADAVRAFLGIGPGGANRALLERRWQPGPPRRGWLYWRAPLDPAMPLAATGATYKLYLSPSPEALAEGFGTILAGLAAARVRRFKVGDAAPGLLRPDKIVAHFASFEELAEAAGRLAERLAGLPVQGVPFTAEIGGGGLLSWGADPPPGERSLAWGGEESWRLWLARRLAQGLLDARAAGEAEPWRSAVLRLRLDGVDTETWAPEARLWREG